MRAKISEEVLNDYIKPGPICVNPAGSGSRSNGLGSNALSSNVVSSNELEVGQESSKSEKVSISLQDCLACAGCITSSEEILLSKQSQTVFFDTWKRLSISDTSLVISVAPQCRVSLAQHFGFSLKQMDAALLSIFSNVLHCQYAVGTELGRAIAIQHTNAQLIQLRNKDSYDPSKGFRLPRICSVCPGFVLYAEKTKPELVPLLLNVKSPQQITGSLLRETLPSESKIFHLSIMPCFDKKLEASRPDAMEERVDCVLTPKEFLVLMQQLEIDIKDHLNGNLSQLACSLSPPGWDPRLHWASNAGSSSGGYAFQYAKYVQTLNPGSKIHILQGRNGDVREYRVTASNDSKKVFASTSELYGFRNIQNMVRKLKGIRSRRDGRVPVIRKRGIKTESVQAEDSNMQADPYGGEFIEVMACPGGCINGGGLLADKSDAKHSGIARHLNERYQKELIELDPLSMFLGPASQKSYEYTFHALENTNNAVAVNETW